MQFSILRTAIQPTRAALRWSTVHSKTTTVLLRTTLAAILIAGSPLLLKAQGNCAYFDVVQHVACRRVNSPQRESVKSEQGPQEECDQWLIDAEFDVSTLIRSGYASKVEQLLFVIDNPARTLQVVDYAPRTELMSQYVGPIERSHVHDQNSGGGLKANFSPTNLVTASANATNARKSSETIRYQTIAPMQVLAASGTASRGTAVYFKFQATPQTTLEGSRRLRVMFRVPRGWRADYVFVRCGAFANSTGPTPNSATCGSADFLVPLYMHGDAEAREAASRLVAAETTLREGADRLRRQIEHQRVATDSIGHKLTSIFTPRAKQQRLPPRWLTTVLTSSPTRRDFSFQTQLPGSVADAVAEFTTVRTDLFELNGT